MYNFRKSNDYPKDYRERFEFRLTFDNNIIKNNIICQRYFAINDFNPRCLSSIDLTDSIRFCADLIDRELKSKTARFLDINSPRIFKSKEEMENYLSKEENRAGVRLGEGLVVRNDEENNYVWAGDHIISSPTLFSDPEYTKDITDEDVTLYKLSFLVDGKVVASAIWEGIYPKYIRKSIDLTNRVPKIEENETIRPMTSKDVYSVGFDAYLRYRLVEGRGDLAYKIIKELTNVCSYPNKKDYTIGFQFKDDKNKIIKYKNKVVENVSNNEVN